MCLKLLMVTTLALFIDIIMLLLQHKFICNVNVDIECPVDKLIYVSEQHSKEKLSASIIKTPIYE